MSSQPVEIEIRVESNVDRLSETAVKHFFADAVNSTVHDAEEFLRAVVPKLTGEMASRIGRIDANPADAILIAAVGIPRIEVIAGVSPAVKDMFVPGEQDPGNYPLFRDKGTGVHGPSHEPIHARKVSVMKWTGSEGYPIFRAEVKGSEGSHFMLATYAFTKLALQAQMHEMGERVQRLPATGASL